MTAVERRISNSKTTLTALELKACTQQACFKKLGRKNKLIILKLFLLYQKGNSLYKEGIGPFSFNQKESIVTLRHTKDSRQYMLQETIVEDPKLTGINHKVKENKLGYVPKSRIPERGLNTKSIGTSMRSNR